MSSLSVNLANVRISTQQVKDVFDDVDKNGDFKIDAEEAAKYTRVLISKKAAKLEEANKAKRDLSAALGLGGGPMAAVLPALLGSNGSNPFLFETPESKRLKADADKFDTQIAFFARLAVGGDGTGGSDGSTGLIAKAFSGGLTRADIDAIAKNGSGPDGDSFITNADIDAYANYSKLTATELKPGDSVSNNIRTISKDASTAGSGNDMLLKLLKPLLGPMGALLEVFLPSSSTRDIDSADAGKPDILTLLLPLLLTGGGGGGGFGGGAPQGAGGFGQDPFGGGFPF